MSLLARLIEAGTPADLVAEVARELARAEVAQEAIEKRRAADRERQDRRRAKNNVMSRDTADVTSDPALSRPPNEINSNPPTHTHPDNPTPRTRGADPFPCPEWCEPAVWADLKRNRKTKKLTNTATAHRQFVAAVEAMADDEWPPGRLVEAIAAKGWGGAYDPREDTSPNDRPTRNRRTDTGRGGSTRNAAQIALERLHHCQ